MKNKTILRMKQMIKPHTKTIVIVTLLALCISIAELIKPYIIKIVIDEYLSKGIWQKGAITIGMLGVRIYCNCTFGEYY